MKRPDAITATLNPGNRKRNMLKSYKQAETMDIQYPQIIMKTLSFPNCCTPAFSNPKLISYFLVKESCSLFLSPTRHSYFTITKHLLLLSSTILNLWQIPKVIIESNIGQRNNMDQMQTIRQGNFSKLKLPEIKS